MSENRRTLGEINRGQRPQHSYGNRAENITEKTLPITERRQGRTGLTKEMEEALAAPSDDDALQNLLQQGREIDDQIEFPPLNGEEETPPPPVDPYRRGADGRPVTVINKVRRPMTNSPVSDNVPRPPPPITPMQKQVGKVMRGEDEDELTEADKPKAKPRFIMKKTVSDPNYLRVELLSGFRFYTWKDVQARRINIIDQPKIFLAQQTRDISALIDVLGSTLANDVDIRDFTVADFYYFLYWHRLRSYTTVPFVVTWTSKYGNENLYTISDTEIKYVEPTITEERYAYWQELGFSVPTVRDFEFWVNEELSVEERWIFDRAQYMRGEPNEDGEIDLQSKIDALNDKGMDSVDFLGQLPIFKQEIEHSVVEEVLLTDAKFDPKKYLLEIKTQIEQLNRQAELIGVSNPGRYLSVRAEAEELQETYDAVSTQLEEGGEVLPDVETVKLNLHPLDFFPSLF